MADEIIPAAQDVLTVQRKLRPSRQLSLRWRSWRRLRAGIFLLICNYSPRASALPVLCRLGHWPPQIKEEAELDVRSPRLLLW